MSFVFEILFILSQSSAKYQVKRLVRFGFFQVMIQFEGGFGIIDGYSYSS